MHRTTTRAGHRGGRVSVSATPAAVVGNDRDLGNSRGSASNTRNPPKTPKTAKKDTSASALARAQTQRFRSTSESRTESSEDHSMDAGGGQNIRVCARFRPVRRGEDDCKELDFSLASQGVVTVDEPRREFHLDKLFLQDSTHEEVFNWATEGTASLKGSLRGLNVTILAYGQTGSGKTHTMFGDLDNLPTAGVIPRICMSLFDLMSSDQQSIEFTCSCSMLEIYREELFDLLEQTNLPLHIKETRDGGVFVENLSQHYVSDYEQILGYVDIGNKVKAVASTKMNAESSRSHTIVVLDIVMKGNDGSINRGRLNLVDLAGSEKIKRTGAEGETLEEAKKINLSLTALSHCIYALTKQESHIPFRSSKLTRFLQSSLGGNSKTTLIVACSSEESSIHETISSLEFATRAKKIRNKVTANIELSAEILKDKLIAAEFELSSLRLYCQQLESFAISQGLTPPKPSDPKLLLTNGSANGIVSNSNNETMPREPAIRATSASVGAVDDLRHHEMLDQDGTRRTVSEYDVLRGGEGMGYDNDGINDLLKAMDEIEIGLKKKEPLRPGFTGHLKQKFTDKMSALAKRKSRMGSDGSPAISYAEYLARTPSIAEATPDRTEELTMQIVSFKTEIDALNAEIEGIYKIVLAHEVEVARALDAKNLEIRTLKLCLATANPSEKTDAGSDVGSDPSRMLKTMASMKYGKQLLKSPSFKAFSTHEAIEEALDSSRKSARTSSAEVDKALSGSLKRRESKGEGGGSSEPDAFTQLSNKFAEQSALMDSNDDDIKIEQIVVMQQDVIRDLESRLTFMESENERLQIERDALKTSNSELQLQVATLRQSIRTRKPANVGQMPSIPDDNAPPPVGLRRTTSDGLFSLAHSAAVEHLEPGNRHSIKLVMPIVPRRVLSLVPSTNQLVDDNDEELPMLTLPWEQERDEREAKQRLKMESKSFTVANSSGILPNRSSPIKPFAENEPPAVLKKQDSLFDGDFPDLPGRVTALTEPLPSEDSKKAEPEIAPVKAPEPATVPETTPKSTEQTLPKIQQSIQKSPMPSSMSSKGVVPTPEMMPRPSIEELVAKGQIQSAVKMIDLSADPKWKKISGGTPTAAVTIESDRSIISEKGK